MIQMGMEGFDLGEIIVAFLALLGTLGGSWLANRRSAVLISYRLQQLEEKVNLHNKVVERTYHLEEKEALMEEKLKVASHRIDDLECYHKPKK